MWSNQYGDITAVAVYVQRLRKKIEADPSVPEFIETVHGMGYRFNRETHSRMKLRTQFVLLVAGIIVVPILVGALVVMFQYLAARGQGAGPQLRCGH